MEKALFLYSDATGNGKASRLAPKIAARLGDAFEIESKECESLEELLRLVRESIGRYEALILASGDGTFRAVASVLLGKENAPALGYINAGTLGDVGRNFGVGRNWKKACDIIRSKKIKAVDLCSYGGETFAYMAAVGAYSDIAYAAKRSKKKRIGKFSYYGLAMKEAFHPKRVHGTIEHDGAVDAFESPFLLVLNGRRVGGFSVNRVGAMDDGRIEIFYSDQGAFNGLLHYLFHDRHVHRLQTSSACIHLEGEHPWCFDGEKGAPSSQLLEVYPQSLRVYSK